MPRSIVSVLLENEPGALSRVVGLFSQRGYNIESLTVAPTDDATLSRLNITSHVVDDASREQIEKQLHKLVDILKVSNVSSADHIERELMLLKVKISGSGRDEVKRMSDIFRGQVVDVTANLFTVQLVGNSAKLDGFLTAMADVAEIIEVARSGVVGIARGDRVLRP
ncbi:acetolactate synthase small subunit [Ferrimonas pelagia]|uniref:Acetolactate synthase small subunit n=1 Tax=Ferrimonas pelagia TaxID=1177826 RepID=A0ABP9EPH2_9GAMM